MLWHNVHRWLTVVWIVSFASLAALPTNPANTQALELEPNRSLPTVGKEHGFGAVRHCSATSTLLYAETVIVLKDDPTSLINGTIAISIGSPVTIECVRIVAKTAHGRAALQGYRFVSPQVIEVTVAELPPVQSNGLDYTMYVYGSVGPKLSKPNRAKLSSK